MVQGGWFGSLPASSAPGAPATHSVRRPLDLLRRGRGLSRDRRGLLRRPGSVQVPGSAGRVVLSG